VQGFVHIVDDDASFRTAMERRLRHAGYEVVTYASAQQLLEHLPSESIPSCVLLDRFVLPQWEPGNFAYLCYLYCIFGRR